MVLTPDNRPVPILNIITLTRGEWDFRPIQVDLVNMEGRIADIKRFSMNTGVDGEPYLTNYLNVLGNSFIGVDLVGDFEEFRQLSEVRIQLGKDLFSWPLCRHLNMSCWPPGSNQINVDSPDIREDYKILGIRHLGEREVSRAAGRTGSYR